MGSVRHVLTNTIDLGVMCLLRAAFLLSQKAVSWRRGRTAKGLVGSEIKRRERLSAERHDSHGMNSNMMSKAQ